MRLDVDLADLPLLERRLQPGLEPSLLLLVAHREPVLDEVDAVFDQHALEARTLPQEELVLLLGAEAHDMFDARPVVPAAVEQHDLSPRREVGDVALEVPLRLLFFVGRWQGRDAACAGAEVVGDALDRAALPRSVATFEHDDDALLLLPHPLLELHQLDLQALQLCLVGLLRKLRCVWWCHAAQSSRRCGALCSSRRSAGHLPESSALYVQSGCLLRWRSLNTASSPSRSTSSVISAGSTDRAEPSTWAWNSSPKPVRMLPTTASGGRPSQPRA